MLDPCLYIVKLSGALVDHRYIDSTVFRTLWQQIPRYLEASWADAAVQAGVEALRAEAAAERMSGRVDFVRIPHDEGDAATREACVEALRRKIQESRRTPAVVSLGGRILESAFRSGDVRPHLYADVRAAMQRWQQRGCAIAVYDEWPEAVQRAWLETSVAGDLTPLVTRFVSLDEADTRSPEVYATLADALGRPARLATDRTFEALAASSAGLDAVVLERAGVFGTAPHGLRVETNLLGV